MIIPPSASEEEPKTHRNVETEIKIPVPPRHEVKVLDALVMMTTVMDISAFVSSGMIVVKQSVVSSPAALSIFHCLLAGFDRLVHQFSELRNEVH
ncbi:hypothetical protein N7489_005003 [Penicillium chrysogenum]|uniref:uncharacterized protein n=1 Tax=Penicillium chrysogenum TaxID=5076 RepID=UPI0024DF1FCE|nr:uncharacterized protein N7489_005003 [Penicillium chrysogenum]KAJ5244907.1 hypothetical protein N7489_005003 [Penicillium chrysogenum]